MKNFHITHLLNMVAEDGLISRSHGIRTDILRLQAEVIGLPIVQVSSSWGTYEAEFKKALSDLKCEGVEAGIFGDSEKITRDQRCFLDILECELTEQ